MKLTQITKITRITRGYGGKQKLAYTDFLPTLNEGIYIQQTGDVGCYHIFYPINTKGDCASWNLRQEYSPYVRVFQGGIKKAYKYVNATLIGTFPGSGATEYTTTVGNTISLTFNGTSISFQSFTDNRGGMWSFVVDGGDAIVKSTWATSGAYLIQLIAENLDYGSHTIVGTFTGADPDHAPTGGTARGWVCDAADTTGTLFLRKAFIYQDYKDFNYISYDKGIVYDNSCHPQGAVSDFAFGIKKKGSVVATAYIPDHTAAATIKFTDEATQKTITVDGEAYSLATNVQQFATKHNEIILSQECIGFNINETAEDLLGILQTSTFNYKGVLQDCKLTILQNCETDTKNCYISMLPIAHANFDNSIMDGVEYATTKTDGTNQEISTPDTAFKYSVNTKKAGTGESARVVYGEQLLTGATSFNITDGNTKLVFLRFADATGHKLYCQIAASEDLNEGNIYQWQTFYFMNKIDDAYNYAAGKLL